MSSLTRLTERIICFFNGHKYTNRHTNIPYWVCFRCGEMKEDKRSEWERRVIRNIHEVFNARTKGKYHGEERKDIVCE